MNRWLLKGLNGANPLAFLAALGTLRTATLAWPNFMCHMAWTRGEGGWRPELIVNTEEKLDLVGVLASELVCMREHKAYSFADDLSITSNQYAEIAKQATEDVGTKNRQFVDFLAAFGTGVQDEKSRMLTTAFKLLGGGQTSFMGSIRIFVKDTKAEHLSKALLEPWRYDEPLEKHTMRWDPRDDVRRALRWNEPSGDPARKVQGSVWGANRLAIEALPLLPSAPVGGRLETTGFLQRKGVGVFWTWPIWEVSVNADVVRSLLALAELQAEVPNRRQLEAMGIKEICRCERFTQGKYRNFTAGIPV